MEDTLREIQEYFPESYKIVLILVLMEDTLRVYLAMYLLRTNLS